MIEADLEGRTGVFGVCKNFGALVETVLIIFDTVLLVVLIVVADRRHPDAQ
ncbi:hypothetical protein D3C81_2340100 [compost metagenome]